jgi:DNA-directed RNA polymerase subunit M/transcription elongation factor TFIIS
MLKSCPNCGSILIVKLDRLSGLIAQYIGYCNDCGTLYNRDTGEIINKPGEKL